MNLHFEELLDRVTKFIEHEIKTETVIGDSFTLGEFTCVPVIRAGMGFGTGAGEGDAPKQGHGEGGGVGAGMGIEPIGFLVSKGDEITFISTKTKGGLTTAFEKVPEILEKFLATREQPKATIEA